MSVTSSHEPDWGVLDFPVRKTPLTTRVAGKEVAVKHLRTVAREDTGEILKVVGRDYKLVPHREFFEPIHDAIIAENSLEVQDVQTEMGLQGAYAACTWTFGGDHLQEVLQDDTVAFQVIAKNSYNYRSSLVLSVGARRIVCTNGLTIPIVEAVTRRRHRPSVILGELFATLESLPEVQEKVLPLWTQWGEMDITSAAFRDALTEAGFLGKRAIEKVASYFVSRPRHTVWEAYNALTWWATHNLPEGRADRQMIRRETLQREALGFVQTLTRAA